MNRKYIVLFLLFPLLLSCGLKEARLKRQNEAISYYKLGIAHLSGKVPALQKAYIEFQKAVRVDDKHRDAYYALGHIYFLQERYDDAEKSLKKALDIDEGYSAARNYLGRVYSLQGQPQKAIKSYRLALENLEYETPEKPYWNLGLLYMREWQYEEAIVALKNALRVNPGLVPVHTLIGTVYEKMGDSKSAITAYKKAIDIAPEDVNAHYKLACLYQEQGARTLADAGFNQVMALSPELAKEKELKSCLNPT